MHIPEDRHVTIADVARAANVSRTLVSFVLNGRNKDVAPNTRARILLAIQELGYRPNAVARNLATKRAGAIGIVCNMESYQDPLDMQFLAAILTTASEMGQRVMLIPVDNQQIHEAASEHAVDGIIFIDERLSDARISDLRDMGFPAVGLWGNHMDVALHSVIEELALHLEARGLQHIACLYESSDMLFVTNFKQMLTSTLQTHGMTTTIYHCTPDTEGEIVRSIAHASQKHGVTAIVAASDKLAINAIHTLHSTRLRVPDDCAVTGFGDIPAAQWVQPSLTTIRVPVSAMARWAVNHIFATEHTYKQQAPPTINCRLIVRRSC